MKLYHKYFFWTILLLFISLLLFSCAKKTPPKPAPPPASNQEDVTARTDRMNNRPSNPSAYDSGGARRPSANPSVPARLQPSNPVRPASSSSENPPISPPQKPPQPSESPGTRPAQEIEIKEQEQIAEAIDCGEDGKVNLYASKDAKGEFSISLRAKKQDGEKNWDIAKGANQTLTDSKIEVLRSNECIDLECKNMRYKLQFIESDEGEGKKRFTPVLISKEELKPAPNPVCEEPQGAPSSGTPIEQLSQDSGNAVAQIPLPPGKVTVWIFKSSREKGVCGNCDLFDTYFQGLDARKKARMNPAQFYVNFGGDKEKHAQILRERMSGRNRGLPIIFIGPNENQLTEYDMWSARPVLNSL